MMENWNKSLIHKLGWNVILYGCNMVCKLTEKLYSNGFLAARKIVDI